MHDNISQKLLAAAEQMDVPGNAAEMLTHTAAILDAVSVLVNILPNIDGDDRGQVVRTLRDLMEGTEVQEDLRKLAKWFEKYPHSNNNAWLGTHACEAYNEEQREQE